MSERSKVLIWDLPLRLFHWLLVGLVVFSWYSIEVEENLDWHFISGYCVLFLLLFRLLWGFLGSYYARFKNFLFGPSEILNYAKNLMGKTETHYAGHNPLGSLSVFALLLLLLFQAATGLFANDEDYYFGPLSDLVSTRTADVLTEIHHFSFNILLAFIVLHIAAIVFYRLVKKENLVRAMLTGRKEMEDGETVDVPDSRLLPALGVALMAAGAVYVLVAIIGTA